MCVCVCVCVCVGVCTCAHVRIHLTIDTLHYRVYNAYHLVWCVSSSHLSLCKFYVWSSTHHPVLGDLDRSEVLRTSLVHICHIDRGNSASGCGQEVSTGYHMMYRCITCLVTVSTCLNRDLYCIICYFQPKNDLL